MLRTLPVIGFFVLLWVAIWLTVTVVKAQSDRYDPTSDPNVQSYMVCVQLASGGGDNSNLPPASAFDEAGYVQWANGTTKAILCQDVDK
jgi:hypothetical protein